MVLVLGEVSGVVDQIDVGRYDALHRLRQPGDPGVRGLQLDIPWSLPDARVSTPTTPRGSLP